MAVELGTTNDPNALVPGDSDAVLATAASMTAYGDMLVEAGEALKRIDSSEGWEGEAAEQFRSAFDGEPTKWLEAGDCFHDAAGALERYGDALTRAQGEAAEAIRLWNEGEAATRGAQAEHTRATEQAKQRAPDGVPAASIPFTDPGEAKRQAARDVLARARDQLAAAGETAADTVAAARDKAPERGWLDDVGEALGNAAGAAVNALASFGNSALHHPEMVLGVLGGAALTAVSATGEVVGVGLDATGVGAVAGVPLGGLSTAGIVTGIGMMGVSMAGLASEAAGDDGVEVVDTDNTESVPEATTAEPPKEITGLTKHGEERAMGRDGHGVNDDAMKEAVENPTKPPQEQPGGKFKYEGADATVILNKDGKVITTWATSSKGWRLP